MTVLLIVLGLVAALLAICLIRAVLLKPTEAVNATVELKNEETDKYYGSRLAEMIRMETISCRGEENLDKFYRHHETLAQLFPNVHARCEKIDLEGSLLFKWAGKGKAEPIVLMSHQDVVEAGGTWEHGAFSGDIDEAGNVWGRGTVDTKGSLFCIFSALEELIASGHEPDGDVYIATSCTEEIGGKGAPDTAKYLKDHGVRPALILDEGGMVLDAPIGGVQGIYAMVGLVEKGYADVKFIARSGGGHASAPGKNTPLVRLGKFMVDVEKNYPFRSELTPTVTEMFTRMAPNMNFGMKLIFSNLWLFRPLLVKLLPSINAAAGAMIRTTLAFTTAKGSDGLNVLPQEAYVTGNMRLIHHQPNAESIELISKLAAKYGIETEVLYQTDPCPVVDYHSRQFQLVEDVTSKVYPGVQVTPYVMTGGTDARFYSDICDNCIRFAPLYINKQQYSSIHGLNENIHQGALRYGVEFYKNIILRAAELNG